MTTEQATTIIDYDVASCPRCKKAHPFKLKGLAQRKAEEEVPIFGGTGGAEETEQESEVLFTCPDTHKKFTRSIPNPAGVEIIGLASEDDIALAANSAAAPSPAKGDFEQWAAKSRDTALDFCKMMLSASTG